MTVEIMPGMIFVDVPEGMRFYEIDSNRVPIFTDDNLGLWYEEGYKPLPEGNWTFLFCTADASEEQCAGIVEKDWDSDVEGEPPYTRYMRWDVFKNYESGDFELDTAKESLQSLLKSVGLDPKGNYPVLKKIE